MKLSIRHDTTYSYASDVSNSIQFLRLTPRSSERQRIVEWQLDLPCKVKSQIDPYGNILHVLTLDKPHGHLALTASARSKSTRPANRRQPASHPCRSCVAAT